MSDAHIVLLLLASMWSWLTPWPWRDDIGVLLLVFVTNEAVAAFRIWRKGR